MGQGFGGFGMPEAALPNGGTMTPGSRPYNMALGATSQPKLPSPEMADATSPELGNSNVVSNAPNPSAIGSAGNPSSPGPSKAHKLLTILQSGLQGALAGRAADERAVAASGGHRSGGFGGGFEAGFTLPWQRQQQQLGLQQQQAQIGALKAQSDLIQTPNGPIPGWLAKTVLPAQIRGSATENAADTRAGATVQGAQIGAGGRVQGAQIGADARIKAAQIGLGPLAQVPQELQDQFGLPAQLPLKMLNQAESAANKPLTVVPGENDSFVVNKQSQAKTPLGVGNRGAGAVNAGLVPVADENNPGVVTYSRRGNAVGKQSPQGAATQAAKTEARSEVPTKIGDQKVAFNTMIQHADLLKSAILALHNGDEQTLSSLKNRLKAEFGVAGPVTAEAIANAYQHEVVSVIAKGHMTDAEVSKSGKVLNVNAQSPEQSLGVLDAYRALAQSKMNMLTNQANAAKGGNQATGGVSAADMLKKYPPKK